jgi:hypothetical protein
MQRLAIALLCAASLAIAVHPASARVNVTVGIELPPPPVVEFQVEPNVVVVPQTHVYYAPAVTEYDMYRYGPYWYINRSGYWYRSRAYRGPYTAVEYRYVPRQVVVVPARYRHHPPHPHGKPHRHAKYYTD